MIIINKERNSYFDNLKGFLILSVIIGNSLELASVKNVDIHYFILFLYIFHMPLFAFVSGYFCKLSRRTTQEKVKDTVKLYVIVQIVYVIFNYLIMGNKGTKLEFLMPQWTLWYLFSLGIWYIISDYVKNYKKWILVTMAISLLLGFDGSIGTTGSASRTIFFLPFFIAGLAMKEEYLQIINKKRKILMAFGVVLLIILFILNHSVPIELFFEYTKYTWYFETPWFPLFMRMFHYISAFVIGAAIMSIIPKAKNKLSDIGKSSLIIYIVHSGVAQILIGYGILKYTNLINVIISTILYVLIVLMLTFVYKKVKKNV